MSILKGTNQLPSPRRNPKLAKAKATPTKANKPKAPPSKTAKRSPDGFWRLPMSILQTMAQLPGDDFQTTGIRTKARREIARRGGSVVRNRKDDNGGLPHRISGTIRRV